MFAKIEQGAITEYPVHIGTLRKRHPNMSLPKRPTDDVLASLGYAYVELQDKPSAGQYQTVTEGDPALVDGVWTQQWVVSDQDVETVRTKQLKALRDANNAFVEAHYDRPTKETLLALSVKAEKNGWTDLSNHLEQAFDWISGTVLTYYYTKKAEIQASDDPKSVTWSFSANCAEDPANHVTIQSARALIPE